MKYLLRRVMPDGQCAMKKAKARHPTAAPSDAKECAFTPVMLLILVETPYMSNRMRQATGSIGAECVARGHGFSFRLIS
jgi:hypothetical protein